MVTTIGSNFEKRWLEKRGSCAKILADLMHNTSGKLQRNDFMDHVAYSSEGVLQQADYRGFPATSLGYSMWGSASGALESRVWESLRLYMQLLNRAPQHDGLCIGGRA